MAYKVAEEAQKRAIDEITRVKLAGKTVLDLRGPRFRAMDRIPMEISTLTRLLTLRLAESAITDLTPLAGLVDLQELDLKLTAVSDLAPLAGLTALQRLDLKQTAVSDIAALAGLTSLQTIDLDQTATADLSPLANLTALEILFLDFTAVTDLTPLAKLTALKKLVLDHTAVIDLTPLCGLSALADLRLEGSSVADLRPLCTFRSVRTGGFSRLSFQSSEATVLDGELARLANISSIGARARQTLAYLRTLPPWPEPYFPRVRTDGQAPELIGKKADITPPIPTLRTPETQIANLLRHAVVTRMTAAQLANQIASALRGIPASDGNQLPPVLQLMSEVSEVLSMMGDAQRSAAEDERYLRLRIAQLEALVEKLTLQISDASEAMKAAQALAKSDGFFTSFRKASGTAAGAGTVALVAVGVPTAVIYFLGAEHPLVQAYLTAIGRLPK